MNILFMIAIISTACAMTFEEYDRNNDGLIDRNEFMFAQYDRDNNGVIDAREFEFAREPKNEAWHNSDNLVESDAFVMKQFGVAVPAAPGQGGVPNLISAGVAYLNQHLETEGIWRLAGTEQVTDYLKTKFDLVPNYALPPAGQNLRITTAGEKKMVAVTIGDVTDLMVKWMKEVPDGLVPPAVCRLLLLQAGAPDEHLKMIIDHMGANLEANSATLKFLIRHWKAVAAHAAHTLMTPKKLADVTAAAVFNGYLYAYFAKGDVLAYHQKFQATQRVLQRLIEMPGDWP